jgi:hypothetical protein
VRAGSGYNEEERRNVASERFPIRSHGFGFQPEITIKIAKRQTRVYEVPISYEGRTDEGKKIGFKDAINAV